MSDGHRHRNRRRRTWTRTLGFAVLAILVAAAIGCPDGDLENPSDADSASDAAAVELADRVVHTELDTRTADGAHTCAFFPDSCPDGSNCYSVVVDDERARRCLSHDSGEAGDPCTGSDLGSCGDGLRCYRERCRSICNPDDVAQYGCESGAVCLRLHTQRGPLPWGVCIEKSDKCTLWPNDDCPDGENCYALRQGHRCLEYNPNAESGDPCSGSSECNEDQVCVRRARDSGDSGVCRDKCDDDHPCTTGSCRSISDQGYGACFQNTDAG